MNNANKKDTSFANETKNLIAIMEEAVSKNDFKTYYAAKGMLDESIDSYKREKALEQELDTTNFFVLNKIFEDKLPKLFFNDKKTVAKVIKLIREDKNLRSQFSFINAVRNYKGKKADAMSSGDMLGVLEGLVSENIDKESVRASNAKFRNLLKECNVVPDEFIDKSEKNLYESFSTIITNNMTPENMLVMEESRKNVIKYLDEHKNDKDGEDIDTIKMMEDFEKKMDETLNESESMLVNDIIKSKEGKREKFFEQFKNECVAKIDTMLEKDSSNDELKSLRDEIKSQKFCDETIVSDIAKLLEIRTILDSE